MLGTSSSLERLPVVELRPFVSRQWLPSKSRPEFGDRSLTSLSGFSSISSQTTSATSQSYSPRRTHGLALDARRPIAQRSISLPPNKWSVKQSNYMQESPRLRVDETRTSKEFPPPVRNYSETADQKTMEVQGQRIKDDRRGNLRLFHSNHWEYYKSTRSEPTKSVGVTSGKMSPDMENIRSRIEHLENSYVNDNIYDNFDRANTLPSISVQTAPMRRRRGRNDRKPSAKVPSKVPYRLGVVNSLDVLSHFGQPGRIERHLTMQLKNTIQQLRRTKDNMPGARVLYRFENCSTPGESLMQNADSGQDQTPFLTPRKMTGLSEARTIPESKTKESEESALSRKLAVMIPPAINDDPMPSPAVQETGSNGEVQAHLVIDSEEVKQNTGDKETEVDAQPTNDQLQEAKGGPEIQTDEKQIQADDNASEYESSHSGID